MKTTQNQYPDWLRAAASKGGKSGTGKAKARSRAQAQKAAAARWGNYNGKESKIPENFLAKRINKTGTFTVTESDLREI